ncbi:MAG: hypothetical protein ACE5HP_12905 [Gemmatimonadota bacterium]
MNAARSTPYTLAVLPLLLACAGNPAPGQAGYAYNVEGDYSAEFVAEGTTYAGTAVLGTAPGGAVTGEFQITEPTGVTGTIAGTLTADQLALEMDFEIPDIGCSGSASGTLTVAEGGDSAEGEVEIQADCDSPGRATFRLFR